MKLRMAVGIKQKDVVFTMVIKRESWPRTDEEAMLWLYGQGYTAMAVFELEMPDPPPLPPMPKIVTVQPAAVMET